MTTDVEHFGLIGPAARVRRPRRRRRSGRDAILEAVTAATRLLAISHVLVDDRELARPARELQAETGLPILVDGAQSAGAIPVEAGGFDFYAFVPEMALRAGRDRRARVADPERCASPCRATSRRSRAPAGRLVRRARPGARASTPAGSAGRRSPGLSAALEVAPEWRFERAARDGRAVPRRAGRALRGRHEAGPGGARHVSAARRTRPSSSTRLARAAASIVREIPGRDLIRVSCGYWTSEDGPRPALDRPRSS